MPALMPRRAGLLLLVAALVPSPASACVHDGKHRSRACILGNLAPSPTFYPIADPMPAHVNTILLQEEFETWDVQRAEIMQSFLKELLGFQYFAHARDTFANHLRGTWGILQTWGQPVEICRAGLFHTVYGGDLFIFSTLDPFEEATSRERMREVVDTEAEALTWDFGTLARSLVNATLFQARKPKLPADMLLSSFVGSDRNVSARQIAKIMVVTIADYLDQLVEINLWRDFHSYEPPSLLYPGQMKPEVALYWISRVCKGIREHLDAIPPIFDDCTAELTYEAEKEARDMYWLAISDSTVMGISLQQELLEGAVKRNPFVAEPHVYLAEIDFQKNRFLGCADHARQALNLFYRMGTHWDKRLPYRQWISHTRLLLLRCARRSQGKTSLPLTSQGIVLTNDLVEEMKSVSPIAPPIDFGTRLVKAAKVLGDSCCLSGNTTDVVGAPVTTAFM